MLRKQAGVECMAGHSPPSVGVKKVIERCRRQASTSGLQARFAI